MNTSSASRGGAIISWPLSTGLEQLVNESCNIILGKVHAYTLPGAISAAGTGLN